MLSAVPGSFNADESNKGEQRDRKIETGEGESSQFPFGMRDTGLLMLKPKHVRAALRGLWV